jgi:Homeodomain-like domain
MTTDDLGEREQAALCLARGWTTDKAGEAAGVSGRTVRRWREDPDFEQLVTTARRAMLAEAVAALGSAARDAVTVLHDCLRDDSVSIRLRAALGVLAALPSIAEHVELEERLAALERAVAERRPM